MNSWKAIPSEQRTLPSPALDWLGGAVIALAGVNQTFRGLRLGPLATSNTTRPTLSETAGNGAVTLNWGGSFFLQSATNVTGVYEDVINGTRPYTNSTGSAGQRFFRLRQ